MPLKRSDLLKKAVVVDTELGLIDGRIKVDFSSASMYLKCGQQYKFRYVEGIKSPPAVALLEGSSHHKAMEENNNHKMQKGKDKKHEELTDIFMEDFRTRLKAPENEHLEWEGEREDNIFSRAKVLHVDYINKIAPMIKPIGVEERFEKEVDIDGMSMLVTGYLDLIVPDVVWDYKTKSKSASQGEVDQSLQLSLYAWAKKVSKVGYIQFLKKANPEVGLIQSYRDITQIKWALKVMASVAKGIEAKHFPLCEPSAWHCNPKWCGYFSLCRGKYEAGRT